MISRGSLKPDLVLVLGNTAVHMLKLIISFEANATMNTRRKAAIHHLLCTRLWTKYSCISFHKFCVPYVLIKRFVQPAKARISLSYLCFCLKLNSVLEFVFILQKGPQ